MKLTTNARVLKVGFTLILLFFLSCNNEDLEKPTTVAITKQLQNNLKLEQFANKNLVVNWESLQKAEKDSSEIYEIKVTEKIKSEMVSKVLQKDVKYELISLKRKGEVHSYLIEAFSNLNYITFPGTIQNLSKFTGTLNVYGLNGTQMGHLVVFDGKAENPSKNNALNPLVTTINLFHNTSLTSRVPQCNSVISVYSVEEVWTGRYSVTTLASTGQVLNTRYLGETLTSRTSTLLYSEVLPCGSSGDQEPESATLHRIRTEQYEKEMVDTPLLVSLINDTALDPCYKGVMEQLKKGTVCEIEKVFSKLNADFSKYNTTFKIGPTTGEVANTQRTYPNVRFDYTITIDPDRYTNGTKLFKANALLHELVHVYFSSLVDDYTSGTPSALNDFPSLFQAFVDKKYPNSDKSTLAHHEEMANTYVNAISSALQEYQTGVSVPYGTAQQEYKDLAWHGLEKTAIYGTLSLTDRTRIENRFGAESRGGDVGGQKLIGKPCN